jgi:hypothetical protein
MYFLDATEYDFFKNETEVAMGITMIHRGMTVKFDFPETKLTGSGTPKISGQGVMMADYDWTAFKQDSAYDVKVIVTNTTAGSGIPT